MVRARAPRAAYFGRASSPLQLFLFPSGRGTANNTPPLHSTLCFARLSFPRSLPLPLSRCPIAIAAHAHTHTHTRTTIWIWTRKRTSARGERSTGLPRYACDNKLSLTHQRHRPRYYAIFLHESLCPFPHRPLSCTTNVDICLPPTIYLLYITVYTINKLSCSIVF